MTINYSDWKDRISRFAARDPDPNFEDAIEISKELLACAYQAHKVACKKCGGFASVIYGDTTTWRGGYGGQTITEGVCDKCWGTGRSDKTGPNLRKLSCR